jgi:nuclear cap-binding protein subunit 1
MERLPEASIAGTLRELKSIQVDSMAVDLEESSTMEVDNENERQQKRFSPPPHKKKINNNNKRREDCLQFLYRHPSNSFVLFFFFR